VIFCDARTYTLAFVKVSVTTEELEAETILPLVMIDPSSWAKGHFPNSEESWYRLLSLMFPLTAVVQ
jgi:hypothetical protein